MSSDLRRLAALDQAPQPERRGRSGRPVPGGPIANRRAVRRWGPVAALAAPAGLGAIGALLLWGSTTGWRGVPGFGLIVVAAPVMPLAGVPAEGGSTRYLIAGVLSAVLWLVIGFVAARRATKLPIADWDDWKREYLPLAIGAAGGALCAVFLSYLAVKFDLA